MEQYAITGMSCAACSARIEKAVSAVKGVDSCSVSLLTNSMGVTGTASSADIIRAVEDAGYGASLKGADKAVSAVDEDELVDRETPAMIKRLFVSAGFLLILMYFSMGHMMWGWPLPKFFDGNHVAMGLIQMVLASIVMVINQRFFISGFKAVIHRAPNMDTLVALGSAASFVYSLWMLFKMTDAQAAGGTEAAAALMDELYFESAAMILTLITVGKTLESYSKGRTTDALKSLIKLAPKTANLVRDGIETVVPVENIMIGDTFAVRPGESIPVDGIVIEGESAVNEAALTGESIPVDKAPGDSVSAASINQSGYLLCRASRVGEDTTLSQIIKMVSDAAATKAPIAKTADKVSGIFVPAVIGIAVVTFIIWMLKGAAVGEALTFAVAVLVISCPCALGLATPVAIMVGNGKGSRNGILFKTSASLEEAGRVKIVALDKTGTITKGEPSVTDVITVSAQSESDLLTYAYSLEAKSEHPLAKAIVRKSEDVGLEAEEVSGFTALPGSGLTAELNGKVLYGGNYKYISTVADVPEEALRISEKLSEEGKTPLFFAKDKELLGVIAVADIIKEDSSEAIRELKDMGIYVVMLTGDNERTAKAVGAQAGVDEVISGVLPDEKAGVIGILKEKGKTAMVGDGINDAPALTAADIGIAIGAGTDVAIDAAGIVLMKNTLSDVAAAVRLSRATLKNIKENLFWAFFYNTIGIPVAAGLLTGMGIKLSPMLGAAAMSLSSFCVVTNALRLNLFKMYDTAHDRRSGETITGPIIGTVDSGCGINTEIGEKEKTEMTRTIKVDGMSCAHCENRVKKALEALPQVDEAVVSHEAANAVLTLNAEVEDAVLKKAVEDEGYTFVG